MSSLLFFVFSALLAPVVVPPTGGGIQISEADDERWVRYVEHAGLDTVQLTLYADQAAWDGGALDFGHDAWHRLPGLYVEAAAAHARGLKVMLVLRVKLTMANAVNRHLWHGMIWPRDAALADWFAAYRRFARWGARQAVNIGADLLLIGHELNSMTSTVVGPTLPDLLAYHLAPERTAAVIESRLACATRAERMRDTGEPDGKRFASLRAQLEAEDATRRRWSEVVAGVAAPLAEPVPPMPPALGARRARYARFWRGLAAEIRTIYDGPIGYGANFDQFEAVDFWDALDFIGISSYFSLRALEVPDLDAALRAGWRRVAASIEAVAGPAGRPVILHELGWSRKAGSTIRPYSYRGVTPIETGAGAQAELACIHWRSQPPAPDERQRALAALIDVVEAGHFPSLRGFSVWKLTTEPSHLTSEPFAVLLPLPFLEREADHGFVALARVLLDALRAQADAGD